MHSHPPEWLFSTVSHVDMLHFLCFCVCLCKMKLHCYFIWPKVKVWLLFRSNESLGDFEKYYWNQSALIKSCLLFVRFLIHFLIRSLIHFFSHRKCKRQMHFSLNHFLLWLAYVQLSWINYKLELNLLDLSKSLPWASTDQVSTALRRH